MDLNIFTPDFEFLGTIDTFESLRWRRQVFGTGEMEFHCEANAQNIMLTQEELFVHREGYDELGIIEGRSIAEAEEKGEMIAATGQLCNSILARAVLDRRYNINGPVEVAMRQMVADQMPRVYNRIVLGDLRGFDETITAQVSDRNLWDILAALSRATGILFRLRPDIGAGHFVFETYKGVDRTVGQTENPRVVFSDLDETLESPTYERNIKKHKNFAFIAGEGEGDARVRTTVDRTGNGAARREIFVDAKSVRKGDSTATQYLAELQEFGGEKLDAAGIVENFESQAKSENAYRYREEWELGDLVTAHKDRWGIIIDERITEVEEIYDESTGEAGQILPVFGSPLPEQFKI